MLQWVPVRISREVASHCWKMGTPLAGHGFVVGVFVAAAAGRCYDEAFDCKSLDELLVACELVVDEDCMGGHLKLTLIVVTDVPPCDLAGASV